MDEYEYKRAKPMLWAMFAAAAKAANQSPSKSAQHADDLLEEFEKRFPVEKRGDE